MGRKRKATADTNAVKKTSVKTRRMSKKAAEKTDTQREVIEQPKHEILLRYGLLSLEKTPEHLVEIVTRNALSPLLRLPPELRLKIWEFCMGVPYVHIRKSYEVRDGVGESLCRGRGYQTPEDGLGISQPAPLPTAFHIPEVCRQIYSETATLAYSLNIFVLCGGAFEVWTKQMQDFPAHMCAVQNVEMNAYILCAIYERKSANFGWIHRRTRPTGRTLLGAFPGLKSIRMSPRISCDRQQIKSMIKKYEGEKGKELKVVFRR